MIIQYVQAEIGRNALRGIAVLAFAGHLAPVPYELEIRHVLIVRLPVGKAGTHFQVIEGINFIFQVEESAVVVAGIEKLRVLVVRKDIVFEKILLRHIPDTVGQSPCKSVTPVYGGLRAFYKILAVIGTDGMNAGDAVAAAGRGSNGRAGATAAASTAFGYHGRYRSPGTGRIDVHPAAGAAGIEIRLVDVVGIALEGKLLVIVK